MKIKKIEKLEILYSSSYAQGGRRPKLETVREQATKILEACIAEMEIIGPPNQIYVGSSSSGINLTLSQSQANKQTVSLEIIVNELEESLNKDQLQTIQSIIESDENRRSKKQKIANKLAEFGKDVASNILANILTNPSIIG